MPEQDPTPTPDPKPDPKAEPKPDPKAPTPKKIELTEEELELRINARLTAEQQKAAAKAAKEKEAAERKAAEEQGKHKELAEQEKARADAAEAKLKNAELRDALRAHLDEKEPTLAKAHGVIARLIDGAAADEDRDKAIKAAVDEYKKSLPEAKGGGSPSAPPRTGNRVSGEHQQQQANKDSLPNGRRVFSPASRF